LFNRIIKIIDSLFELKSIPSKSLVNFLQNNIKLKIRGFKDTFQPFVWLSHKCKQASHWSEYPLS
jgi:hypothetical protein